MDYKITKALILLYILLWSAYVTVSMGKINKFITEQEIKRNVLFSGGCNGDCRLKA